MTQRKVLLVEDDFLVRTLLMRTLEDAGFEVLEADGTRQALEQLESDPDIRLAIIDVHLGAGDHGFALADRVAMRFPDTAVIITSARNENAARAAGLGFSFLPKPFMAEVLLRLALDLCAGRVPGCLADRAPVQEPA